ncbi:MAG: hypothetical protein ACI4TE_02810 [Alphaproteobacteria bacterium]
MYCPYGENALPQPAAEASFKNTSKWQATKGAGAQTYKKYVSISQQALTNRQSDTAEEINFNEIDGRKGTARKRNVQKVREHFAASPDEPAIR